MAVPKMYSGVAAWWPLISAPADDDYVEDARLARQLLEQACDARPSTLLELGSGGGNTASHLKAHFDMTLVDLSPEMLEVSRALNPECEHVQGDMRSIRLGRVFDAVYVHDAIMYMTSEADLRAAIERAHGHCRPGGAVLFVPDCVRESFQEGETTHGGEDAPDGRGVRFLEWDMDPDPGDDQFTTHYVMIFREADGSTRIEHDVHTCGLFGRDTWLRILRDVGFEVRIVPDQWRTDNFVAKRPT